MKINLLKAVSKIVTDLKQLYSRRALFSSSSSRCCADVREEARCQMKLRNWIRVSQFFRSCCWRAARSGVTARPLSSCSRRCFVVAPHYRFGPRKATSDFRFSFPRDFSPLGFPPPTNSCLSINVTLSEKNLFTLIFALIRTWLLLMLICSAFDRVPLMSEPRDSRLWKWKKKPIARKDFPLSGLMYRLARQLEKICFYLFSSVWQQITDDAVACVRGWVRRPLITYFESPMVKLAESPFKRNFNLASST